jgi:phospholipase/carboxylesterase
MVHKYISKNTKSLLILLHGTGGNENSLIHLGYEIDEHTNILSIRGNINENGMNRFFKRIAPGIFDTENLFFETTRLYDFIIDFLEEHNLSLENTIAIGYSNGANILGSLLYRYGGLFQGVVLMHPMIPLKDTDVSDQKQMPLLITAGTNDPLVEVGETKRLVSIFKNNNAKIKNGFYGEGHSVSSKEIFDIKQWYNEIKKPTKS